MTLKVTCAECNATLYESQEWQSLETVLESINYTCPNCKRKIPNPAEPKEFLVNGKPLNLKNKPKPRVDLNKKWWRPKK